jgi:hypothetical protein
VAVNAMALPKGVRNNRSLCFQSIASSVRWRRKKIHGNFYIFREIRYTALCQGETLYAAQEFLRSFVGMAQVFSASSHILQSLADAGVPLPVSPDPDCSKTSELAASMGVFLDSTARLNGRARNQILTGTDGVFFWDDPNWGSYWAFRGKLRRKLRTGLLEPQIVDLANFIESEGMRTEVLRRLFSVWLICNSSDRCFQKNYGHSLS